MTGDPCPANGHAVVSTQSCRRCRLRLGQPRVRFIPLSSFSPSLSLFPFHLTPSIQWLPNPRNFPRQCHNNNPLLKSLQSVPFFPDLPPSIGPIIRKFSQPHLHRSLRTASPHHPNPPIRLAHPPFPPPQPPQSPRHLPLQARPRTVTLNLTLLLPISVRLPSKSLFRLLRKPQLTRRQLSWRQRRPLP